MSVIRFLQSSLLVGGLIFGYAYEHAEGLSQEVHGQGSTAECRHSADSSRALETILPIRADHIPQDGKWIATVRVSPPYEGKEFQLSLVRRYDGTVEARLKRPKGVSIRVQLRALNKEHPEASLDKLRKLIALEEWTITQGDLPQLSELARAFEAIRMSPVLPDEFAMDETGYHLGSQSQWGQWMELQLGGPGPGAPKQPHPLLEWAESFRSAVFDHLKESSRSR
jgi:hypothetical protein